MKKIIFPILLLSILTGCGPSKKERENIAKAACSEIMATRKFEEARRIRILNDALKELGEDPYYSSSLFETRLALGGTSSCMDILNPPPPPTAEEIEQERIAEERRKKILKEQRIEREKEAKKRAEEKRIREEQERIANEERERKEAEQRRMAEEKRLEEKRLKEEQERLEQERRLREEEERREYVKENTNTSYLYCPSSSKISRRSDIPKWWTGLIINKLGDEYLNSFIYESNSSVKTARLNNFYKPDKEFSMMRSCQDLIDYSYDYDEQYPSDEVIYKFEQKAIKDAQTDETEPNYYDSELRESGLNYNQQEYLEYRRMLKGAPASLNFGAYVSQENELLDGVEPLFCEKVGTEIYVLEYMRVKPEIKIKNIIVKKNYGNTILESIDKDESILMTGSKRMLNRDELGVARFANQYDSCEIVSKNDFNLKVLKPLEDKFKAVIENKKLILELSKKEVERKI